MDRRWLVVLPNLFTVSSIFCGIYAITLATGATGPADFFPAAVAILFGMFFDGCDGRVARLTRTESDFGVQLDSLADVITFGAAPAVLVYKFALAPLGVVGILIAATYASCGALRLARFNVQSSRETGPARFFTGLPIPLAAGMVVSVVIAATRADPPQALPAVPAAVLVLVLSYLMVSTVQYHTFKTARPRRRDLLLLGAVLGFGALVAVQIRPSFVLVAWFSAYILLGLVEEIVLRRRRAEALELAAHPAARSVAPSVAAVGDGVDGDEADESDD